MHIRRTVHGEQIRIPVESGKISAVYVHITANHDSCSDLLPCVHVRSGAAIRTAVGSLGVGVYGWRAISCRLHVQRIGDQNTEADGGYP